MDDIKVSMCKDCYNCHRKNEFNKFSSDNLEFVERPPSFLPKLTPIEIQLISRACLIVNVVRLPGGQQGYNGHVICIHQDVSKLATALPRLPSEIESFVVVKPGQHVTKKEFTVNRKNIEIWLKYLIEKNPGYRGLDIDYTRLDKLPTNFCYTYLSLK